MSPEPIHIRITVRQVGQPLRTDPRAAFWTAVNTNLEGDSDSRAAIVGLEAKLCREFGPALRRILLNELSEPLRVLDSELLKPFRHLDDMMFEFMHRLRDGGGYQFLEAISRLVEQRRQTIHESPALREVQDRLAAATGVIFATRIAGYASLNLNLSASSFSQLTKVFGGEFDSFRVFLEAFVPQAFGNVFSQDAADRLEFTVNIPSTLEQHFSAATSVRDISSRQTAPVVPQPTISSPGTARERAEWLWRLANGSLILPVLLALFVMYQGMKMLSDIRDAQYDAMKPILEHQLKLLEEDRKRLLRDGPPYSSAQPPPFNPKSE